MKVSVLKTSLYTEMIFSLSDTTRSKYGTAVYIKPDIICEVKPFRCNYNDVEMTMMNLHYKNQPLYIIGIYRSSSKVSVTRLIEALTFLHSQCNLDDQNCLKVILGDFNVNTNDSSSDKNKLLEYMTVTNKYTQLVTRNTTDYKSLIDHIYTNISDQDILLSGVLESYFSDHKPIFIKLK